MQSTFKLNWVSNTARTWPYDRNQSLQWLHRQFKLHHFALPFLRFFKCGSRNSRLFSGSAFRFWIDKYGHWLTRKILKYFTENFISFLLTLYFCFAFEKLRPPFCWRAPVCFRSRDLPPRFTCCSVSGTEDRNGRQLRGREDDMVHLYPKKL